MSGSGQLLPFTLTPTVKVDPNEKPLARRQRCIWPLKRYPPGTETLARETHHTADADIFDNLFQRINGQNGVST